MFQSISFKAHGDTDYIYELKDSSFKTEFLTNVGLSINSVAQISKASIGARAIIKEYEKRYVYVPANIVLYYKWIMSRNQITLKQVIDINSRNNPDPDFYEKYLRYLCRSLI